MTAKTTQDRVILLASGIFAALALSAFIVVGVISAQASFSQGVSEQPVEKMVPALARPQNAGDEIEKTLASDAGVHASSSRLLAEENAVPYWVARGENGDVCVLYKMTGDFGGFSCGSPGTLETQGLSVATFANETGEYAEAYLVPVDVSQAVDGAELGLNHPAAGLFTRHEPDEKAAGRVTKIPRADGPPFTFAELNTRQ